MFDFTEPRAECTNSLSGCEGDPNILDLKGTYKVQHYRKGELLDTYKLTNGIATVGMNHILESEFNGGTQVTAWYCGLINNAGFSALAAGDTMASHAGWVETSSYDEADRPEWTAGTAASRAITNSVTMDFTISATVTIKGIFISSDDTKGGTTGTLWSTAAFGSNVSLVDDDVLKVTYTITGT